MKASRKNPKIGDVFVVQPLPEVYYCGHVIETNIQSKNPFINGMCLVFIYNYKTIKPVLPSAEALERNGLLIPPVVINYQGWTKGYYLTIGNIALEQMKNKFDYGFWSTTTRRYYSTTGEELKHKPEYRDIYGLASYGYIGRTIHRLLNDLELFEVEDI
nr:Imm26 family immunity protein [Paenibacillus turpanensis]